MTKVNNLNHIAISVRDLDRSVRFYEDGLGLRKTLVKPVGKNTWRLLRLPAPTTAMSVFLQGADRVGQVELVHWDLPTPADTRPKRAGDPGVFALSFVVSSDQIDALHARLTEIGAICYGEPERSLVENYGEIAVFICEDPDGNQIEIVSLPSKEEVQRYRAGNPQKGAA